MARDYVNSRSKKQSGGTSRFSSSLLWLFIGIMMGLLIPSFGYIKQHVTAIVQGKKRPVREEALLRDPLPQKVSATQNSDNAPEERRPQQQIAANTDQPENIEKAANNSAPDENVDFDFYTILPDSEATKPPATKTLENAEQKLLAPAQTAEKAPAKPKKEEEITLPPPQFKTTSAQAPAEPKPAAKPLPKPPAITSAAPATKTVKANGYILQLGSFKTFEEADQLKAQLSFSGLEAKIKQTTINGITRHRVWIGVYSSLETAEKAQQKLAANNIRSALAQVR